MTVTPQVPAERRGTTTGENEYNAPTNECVKDHSRADNTILIKDW